ncbi:MAG: hypothetical protein JSU86_03205 [Phycisphaerales bacterium]|nr:MAG: hypothetical protein JSU86_03205 [Phycisphaerales bacterium]
MALALTPVALASFLRGAYPYWVKNRRTVESSELEGLFSEIDHYGASVSEDPERTKAKEQAENERSRLEKLDRPVFELDALPLRQALVDLYHPEAELIGKTRSELEYLDEYAYGAGQDSQEGTTARVTGIMAKLEEPSPKDATQEQDNKKRLELRERLRADLKSLRDTVAWYDKTWAIGEWMRTCVTYWVCATLLVTLLVGILPVVHGQGNWNLGFLHWIGLGIAGALLSILLRVHTIHLPELGETDGKLLLLKTVRSIAIGAIAAVLLYAAIWGEALDGRIFPNLPTGKIWSQAGLEIGKIRPAAGNAANPQVDWDLLKNIGLSVFWGVFAGLSPEVLRRLTRLAESSLGESENGGRDE